MLLLLIWYLIKRLYRKRWASGIFGERSTLVDGPFFLCSTRSFSADARIVEPKAYRVTSCTCRQNRAESGGLMAGEAAVTLGGGGLNILRRIRQGPALPSLRDFFLGGETAYCVPRALHAGMPVLQGLNRTMIRCGVRCLVRTCVLRTGW